MADAMWVVIHGVREAGARVERMVVEAIEAARVAVVNAQNDAENTMKRQFETAHARGTPTPSAPGSPPSVVTGTLRRSIQRPAPVRSHMTWVGTVFPSVVYARIQELGGNAGRGGRTRLPARPYVEPTRAAVEGRARALGVAAMRRVVG